MLDYEREKFDAFLKNITGILNPVQTYYDVGINLANYNNIQWSIWATQLEKYEPPKNGKFSKILVPTVDTKRYSWLLEKLMNQKKSVMFIGDSGTAKSVTIFYQLSKLDPIQNIILNINFSS